MNKIKFFLVLAVLVLLASSFTTASAEGQMVMIPAGFVDGEYTTLGDGQSIGYAYIAADPSLVQEFIDNVNFNVTFTDQKGNVVLKLTPEVVHQLWSKPSAARQDTHNLTPLSRAYWKVPLELLPPGEYTMQTIICLSHSLSKEYDADGDGEFDVLLPEDCNRMYVVYIHINGTEKSKLII